MCIERVGAVRIVPAMDKWIALVKSRMREVKFTQEKLAERIGVTQGAVGHWLRKEREPTLERMNEILVVLGIGHLQMNASSDVAELAQAYASDFDAEPVFRYPLRGWSDLTLDQARAELCDYAAQGTAYWLPVEGDAMTAPVGLSVPDGMLVLVDSGLQAEPGKLVIAQLPGGAAVFRQLIEEGGQRYLRPLNPTYPKLPWPEDGEVLGVVVQALIKFT